MALDDKAKSRGLKAEATSAAIGNSSVHFYEFFDPRLFYGLWERIYTIKTDTTLPLNPSTSSNAAKHGTLAALAKHLFGPILNPSGPKARSFRLFQRATLAKIGW